MNIFLSSTCYNLVDLRAEVEKFITENGHTPMLSDRDNFPIPLGKHRHDICIENVNLCDIFLLVIDNRYGAPYYKDSSISITHAEFNEAVRLGKKIIVFTRKNIFNERQSFIKNHSPEKPYIPAYTDNIKTFELIDETQKNVNGYWNQYFEDSPQLKGQLRTILESEFKSTQTEKDKAKSTIGIKIDSLSGLTTNYLVTKFGIKVDEIIPDDIFLKAYNSIPEKMVTFGEILGFEQMPTGDDYVYFTPLRHTGNEGEMIVGISPTAYGKAVREEIGKYLHGKGSVNVSISKE